MKARPQHHGYQNYAETPHIEKVKASNVIDSARASLIQVLENLNFVKVVSIQTSAKGIFYGEAVEHTVNKHATKFNKPKLVFFDKTGRLRQPLKIGPMTLVQAPMGYDHEISIPCVGDLLIGSFVPNSRKSHLDTVLRGWSSEAKPLWELLRILKFGTKMSEFELRTVLIQTCCTLLQCPASLKGARDDIYTVARIVLFSNTRGLQVLASIQTPSTYTLKVQATEIEVTQAGRLSISSSAVDFIDSLTAKLGSPEISELFLQGLNVQEPLLPAPILTYNYAAPQAYGYGLPMYNPSTALVQQRSITPPLNFYAGPYAQENSQVQKASAPEFENCNTNGSKVERHEAQQCKEDNRETLHGSVSKPQKDLHSEGPKSPTPKSPEYYPTSPVYCPQSPEYYPTSPVYCPTSPVYFSTNSVPSSPTQSAPVTKCSSAISDADL